MIKYLILTITILNIFIIPSHQSQNLRSQEDSQQQPQRNLEDNPGNLKFVVELFRHGARGPLQSYFDGSEQQYMWGELTSVGMRQHYNLGKQMREEYIDKKQFLSENFNRHELNVYSSNVNRTIQSAYSHLLGLYPLGTGPKLQNLQPEHRLPPFTPLNEFQNYQNYALENGYQPIPIHQVHQEELIFAEKCPRKDKYEAQYNTNNKKQYDYVWKKYGQKLAEKLEKIFEKTDENLNSLKSLHDLYDTIQSDRYQGRPLPEGYTDDIHQELKFIYDFEWVYKGATGKKNQIMSSELMNFIQSNFYKKIHSNKYEDEGFGQKKWIILSGHDSNLLQVYGALDLSEPKCLLDKKEGRKLHKYQNCLEAPKYASQFLFELYEDIDDYYVRIKFNGEYIKLCQTKDTVCSFKTFQKQIQEYIVEDPWKECGLSRVKSWATQEQVEQYNLVTKENELEYFESKSHFVQIFLMLSLAILLIVFGSIYGKMIYDEDRLKPTLISKGFRSEDNQVKWEEMNETQ